MLTQQISDLNFEFTLGIDQRLIRDDRDEEFEDLYVDAQSAAHRIEVGRPAHRAVAGELRVNDRAIDVQ